jgi:hypothetical protein
MTALEVIRSGWTQDSFARNKAGEPVDWDSPDAVYFCSEAAILKAYSTKLDSEGKPVFGAAAGAIFKLACAIGRQSKDIAYWNDTHAREEVIAAFEKAAI